MGKPTGFLEYRRVEPPHRPVAERLGDHREVELPLPEDALGRQAARCMDCGIPFCHGAPGGPDASALSAGIGCPLGNRVPEFNDLAYRGRWRDACEILHSTNNFPEITGRLCPAPCEAACTLNIDLPDGAGQDAPPGGQPVLIRQVELQIAERGFREGWIHPRPAGRKSGRRVAVVGSGPAGLAAAQQLARAGHEAVVFETDRAVGGLLRYGIPDFKLDKAVLDRRLEQMRAEGVRFQTEVDVGEDISLKYLRRQFDAVCLALGARQPRDLPVPGRGLENIHFALDYLARQNRLNAGEELAPGERIDAGGKVVVVIGGGDTGSDCVGTARRQGAREVHLFEILPQPPQRVDPDAPWPSWPNILRTSSSHEEGCVRRWCVLTKRFAGAGVRVSELHGCEVRWRRANGRWEMQERPGTDFRMRVDLVLLAMGFTHVAHGGLVEKFGLALDPGGNLAVDEAGQTSEPGVFAAGDCVAGASLVVRAIAAGRQAAAAIDRVLK